MIYVDTIIALVMALMALVTVAILITGVWEGMIIHVFTTLAVIGALTAVACMVIDAVINRRNR